MIVLWVSLKYCQEHHPVIEPSLILTFIFLGSTRSAGLTRTTWQERFPSKWFKNFSPFVLASACPTVPRAVVCSYGWVMIASSPTVEVCPFYFFLFPVTCFQEATLVICSLPGLRFGISKGWEWMLPNGCQKNELCLSHFVSSIHLFLQTQCWILALAAFCSVLRSPQLPKLLPFEVPHCHYAFTSGTVF